MGHSQVWVGWNFESDFYNPTPYEGPWLDNILIRIYVPGQVSVQGTLLYEDRNGQDVAARHTQAKLYDLDPNGYDDWLETVSTDDFGSIFIFPTQINWDIDDPDFNPDNRRLDLYVVWETENSDSANATRRVTYFDESNNYSWHSATTNINISDGTAIFDLRINDVNLPAMWIFQDVLRAWETIINNTIPMIDPLSILVKWQHGETTLGLCAGSCFIPNIGFSSYVFIGDDVVTSADTVIHEAGHNYMYNKTGLRTGNDPFCLDHNLFSVESAFCAWGEGWADYFPLAVDSDN